MVRHVEGQGFPWATEPVASFVQTSYKFCPHRAAYSVSDKSDSDPGPFEQTGFHFNEICSQRTCTCDDQRSSLLAERDHRCAHEDGELDVDRTGILSRQLSLREDRHCVSKSYDHHRVRL